MKAFKVSMWAKISCAVFGHEWSRWCSNKKTGERSRFCKRACGVARETRVAIKPVLVQPQDTVIKHD